MKINIVVLIFLFLSQAFGETKSVTHCVYVMDLDGSGRANIDRIITLQESRYSLENDKIIDHSTEQLAEIDVREGAAIDQLNMSPDGTYRSRLQYLLLWTRQALYVEYANLALKNIDLDRVFVGYTQALRGIPFAWYGAPPTEYEAKNLIGFLATNYNIFITRNEQLQAWLVLQRVEKILTMRSAKKEKEVGIELDVAKVEALKNEIIKALSEISDISDQGFKQILYALSRDRIELRIDAPKNPCCGSGCQGCMIFSMRLAGRGFNFSDPTLAQSLLPVYRAIYRLKNILPPEAFQYSGTEELRSQLIKFQNGTLRN